MARRRYQHGCLFKRGKKNSIWVARWREMVTLPDGSTAKVHRSEPIAFVRDVPTRREAQALLGKRLFNLNQGLHRMQALVSFGDFAKKWAEAVLPTYRASTRNFYLYTLKKHLVPHFGHWRLSDVRVPDVQLFLNGKAQRYAPAVLYHIRATLSRLFTTAREWGYIDSNPAVGVKLPQKRNVKKRVTFQPEDVRRILHQLPEPYRTMAAVAALTGVRSSELFALSWEDVDFERRLIRVRRSFYHGQFGPPKTRSSARVIPLGTALAAVLDAHRRSSKPNPSGLVFANANGKPYEPTNIVRRALRSTLRALGLPEAGWRAFRRSVATALSELREPVKTAQEILGHSSPQTTLAVYTQVVEESERRAMAKLEELMFPNVPRIGDADASQP